MNTILKIYYIILFYFIFGKLFFPMHAIVIDILVIGFIFLSAYTEKFRLNIPRKEGRFFLLVIAIPAAIMLVYSLVMQSMYALSSDYFVRSITMCVRLVLYGFFAMRSVYVFGDKSVDVLLHASVVAYLPSIFLFFLETGVIAGVISLFSDNVYHESVALEVHRLTYVFGFITVYFFYQKLVKNKPVLPQAIVSLIFTFLGLKRIVLFALVVAILLMIIFRYQQNKTIYRIILVISCVMIFVALLYVFLIRYGYLQNLFEVLGLRDSFRFKFWNYFASRYDVSLTFFGYGLSYAQRTMANEWFNIDGLGAVTNIHNDILSYYLGLGFVGFILFWGMFFIGQSSIIRRYFSVESAGFAFVISIFYFVIMSTCNEGLPGFIYGFYLMVIFADFFDEKTKNEQVVYNE